MPAILKHEFNPCSVLLRTSTTYKLILHTNRPYTRTRTDPIHAYEPTLLYNYEYYTLPAKFFPTHLPYIQYDTT